MNWRGILPGLLAAALCLGADQGDDQTEASRIAREILDDARPSPEREGLVKRHAALSDRLLAAMVSGLTPGTKEEYRRIPWIWRVAIAAGKRNDSAELRRLIAVALPGPGAKLDDWRAVVIGGGLINGVSQAGDWPGARFDAVLKGDRDLEARWRRSIDLAAAMADDPSIATGTRYDALRMIGTGSWDGRGAQLFRYLIKGVHPELQMGAISGLADVASPCVGQALVSGLGHYSEENLELALDALLRDETRASVLLDALEAGRLKKDRLGKRRLDALLGHPSEAVRTRAGKTLRG